MYLWDDAGVLLPGWPVETGDQIISSAALVDLAGRGWTVFLEWLDRRTPLEMLAPPAVFGLLLLLVRWLRSRAERRLREVVRRGQALTVRILAFDAERERLGADFARGGHAFDLLTDLYPCRGHVLSGRQCQPHTAVSRLVIGTGQGQIAEPGQTHEGLPVTPQPLAQHHDLMQPPGNQGRPADYPGPGRIPIWPHRGPAQAAAGRQILQGR